MLYFLVCFGILEGLFMLGGWNEGREGYKILVKFFGLLDCLRSIKWYLSLMWRSYG